MRIQNNENLAGQPEQEANPPPFSLAGMLQRLTRFILPNNALGNAMSDMLLGRQVREVADAEPPVRAVAERALPLLGQPSLPRSPDVRQERTVCLEIMENLSALREKFTLDELHEWVKKNIGMDDATALDNLLSPAYWMSARRDLLPQLSYICRASKKYDLSSDSLLTFLSCIENSTPRFLERVKQSFARFMLMAKDKPTPQEASEILNIFTDYLSYEEPVGRRLHDELREKTIRFLEEKEIATVKGIKIVLEAISEAQQTDPLLMENFRWLDEGETRGEDAALLLEVTLTYNLREEFKARKTPSLRKILRNALEDLAKLRERLAKDPTLNIEGLFDLSSWATDRTVFPYLRYLRKVTEKYNLEGTCVIAFLCRLENIRPDGPTLKLLGTIQRSFAFLVQMAKDAKTSPIAVSCIFNFMTEFLSNEDANEAAKQCKILREQIMHFLQEKDVDCAEDIAIVSEIMKNLMKNKEPQAHRDLLKKFSWVDEDKTRGEESTRILDQLSRMEGGFEQWKVYIRGKECPQSLLRNALLIRHYGKFGEETDELAPEPLAPILDILGREPSVKQRDTAVVEGLLPILKAQEKTYSLEAMNPLFGTLLQVPGEQYTGPYVQHLLTLANAAELNTFPGFQTLLMNTIDLAHHEEFDNIIAHAVRIVNSGENKEMGVEVGPLVRLLELTPQAARGEEIFITLYHCLQRLPREYSYLLLPLFRRFLCPDQNLDPLRQMFHDAQSLSDKPEDWQAGVPRSLCWTIAKEVLPPKKAETIHAYLKSRPDRELLGLLQEIVLTPPFMLPIYLSSVVERGGPITESPLNQLLGSGTENVRKRVHTWLLNTAQKITETHALEAQLFLLKALWQPRRLYLNQNPILQTKLTQLLHSIRPNLAVATSHTPMRLHKELMIWAKELPSLPTEEIERFRLSWNPQKIQELSTKKNKYRREDLPKGVVSSDRRSIFLEVYENLLANMQELYPSEVDVPLEEIRMLENMRKFLSNPRIHHLLFPASEKVSEYSFYLYKLGEELQRRSQEKPPHAQHTEQQEWLKVVAEGIQACEQGVEEGILATYFLMRRLKDDSPAEPPADASIQVSANRVRTALEDLYLDYLQPTLMLPEEFIGDVAEVDKSKIKQLPHQRHYLQQLILSQFGTPVRWDIHTETVLHRIVEKARDKEQRQEIRKLFFEKTMPIAPLLSLIENAINEDINDFSPRKKKFGVTGLVRFFTGEDPNAENVAKYFKEGDDGYKIRTKAVVEILERLGAVVVLGEDATLLSRKAAPRKP